MGDKAKNGIAKRQSFHEEVQMPSHIVRLFLPLTMVMLLTVFVGLPNSKSHAQSAETEAAEPVGQPASEDAATNDAPAGQAAADAEEGKPVGEPATEANAEAALLIKKWELAKMYGAVLDTTIEFTSGNVLSKPY